MWSLWQAIFLFKMKIYQKFQWSQVQEEGHKRGGGHMTPMTPCNIDKKEYPWDRSQASSDSKDIINNHVNDKKEVVGDPKRSKNSKNSFGKICSESYFEQLLLKEFPWFKSPCGIPNEPVGNKEFWLKRQWWELC